MSHQKNRYPRLEQRAIENAFSAAYPFFRSTLEEKMARRLPSDMGYRPLAGEYSQSPNHPDQVESFTASVRMSSDIPTLQWNVARTLYHALLKVIGEFEPIAESLASAVAETLDSTKGKQSFAGAFHLWSILQLNYSRPSDVGEEFINDLHEDGCLFTMTSTTAPGLEVRTVGGQFIRMGTEPGELLIFPGEILWLLSGGILPPLYHRVRPNSGYKERMSLLFFADMNPKLCQPWHITETNKTVDIGDRVLKNPSRFGLGEWNWK